MITINTNTTAMVAQNNLTTTQGNLNSSMLKLSTGLRINSASDDAAGMQISNRMETQVNGLGVAQRNANDAISMAQTAEGAMVEVTDMLNRMRDLSLQSANDTNTADDRAAMQKEVDALKTEIKRVHDTTNFAGIDLLDGDAANLSFQVGSNANETIGIQISKMATTTLGGEITSDTQSAIDSTATAAFVDAATTSATVGASAVSVDLTEVTDEASLVKALNTKSAETGVSFELDADGTGMIATTSKAADQTVQGKDASNADVVAAAGSVVAGDTTETKHVSDISLTTATGAQKSVKILDEALAQVDAQRADLGVVQNRLESTIDNLGNIEQNMTASQSRIKDVDFAKETTNMTSQQMMMQAGSTVLAQAKQMPQYAAQLMG